MKEKRTATNFIKSSKGRGFSGNHRFQPGKAGAKDADEKLHTNAYSETLSRQDSFLHGAQFRGSAGSEVGTGNRARRSMYPFPVPPFVWFAFWVCSASPLPLRLVEYSQSKGPASNCVGGR